jgi:hypothetical protein
MKTAMRILARTVIVILALFIVPALASQALWQWQGGHATSWNTANWRSANMLPPALDEPEAVIYVMAARTGRWKGGFAVHSWVVTKEKGAAAYNRYDKVGWGSPIRRNSYAADANWYSNAPQIIHSVKGRQAEQLIPRIEKAIESYPYSSRGDYRIWPGPNSNTFVAHVLDEVPELGASLPSNAVGRDFPGYGRVLKVDPDHMNLQVNLMGVAGFAIGRRHGIEFNFLGLVTGVDFFDPAIKLPGFGRIGFF